MTCKKNIPCQEINGKAGLADEMAVREKYRRITLTLIEAGRTVATMESCTCGQIASLLTDTEGASAVFKGAFVTYSNEAKVLQGVPAETIDTFGVYSVETAAAMARICRDAFGADIGIGVTGTFGNVDPNNADSVPGEVFFAIAVTGETTAWQCTVPPQASRPAYKLYIADVIADRLLTLL